VEWLAPVVSLLVIVDYADARAQDTQILMRALSARTGAAVVVLTARSIDGEWLSDIQGSCSATGSSSSPLDLPGQVPDNHYGQTPLTDTDSCARGVSDASDAAPTIKVVSHMY
jgi:hypothetical protein